MPDTQQPYTSNELRQQAADLRSEAEQEATEVWSDGQQRANDLEARAELHDIVRGDLTAAQAAVAESYLSLYELLLQEDVSRMTVMSAVEGMFAAADHYAGTAKRSLNAIKRHTDTSGADDTELPDAPAPIGPQRPPLPPSSIFGAVAQTQAEVEVAADVDVVPEVEVGPEADITRSTTHTSTYALTRPAAEPELAPEPELENALASEPELTHTPQPQRAPEPEPTFTHEPAPISPAQTPQPTTQHATPQPPTPTPQPPTPTPTPPAPTPTPTHVSPTQHDIPGQGTHEPTQHPPINTEVTPTDQPGRTLPKPNIEATPTTTTPHPTTPAPAGNVATTPPPPTRPLTSQHETTSTPKPPPPPETSRPAAPLTDSMRDDIANDIAPGATSITDALENEIANTPIPATSGTEEPIRGRKPEKQLKRLAFSDQPIGLRIAAQLHRTGATLQEVVALTHNQLLPSRNDATLLLVELADGGYAQLPRSMYEELAGRQEDRVGYLLPNTTGGPIDASTLHEMLTDALRGAGK